ncbi:MAG: DUF2892 domain-containing protein [Ancalomicrobiaceae bacterium]|nr:DUF2892 domain-containing protein [Ancalomicrobiaceae bacterium]
MQNVGTLDRIVRIIVGIVLLAVAFVPAADAALHLPALAGAWQWVVAIVGAALIITGLVRFCLLYKLIGLRT